MRAKPTGWQITRNKDEDEALRPPPLPSKSVLRISALKRNKADRKARNLCQQGQSPSGEKPRTPEMLIHLPLHPEHTPLTQVRDRDHTLPTLLKCVNQV